MTNTLDCMACARRRHARCVVWGTDVAEKPDVLVVGDYPGERENETGLPFTGQAGLYLKQVAERVGLDLNRCRLDNAIKCYAPTSPTVAQLRKCSELYLMRDAERFGHILLLGGTALKAFGVRGNVGRLRGRFVYTRIGRPAFVTYNPAYVLRARGLRDGDRIASEFESDLRAFARRLNSGGGQDVWKQTYTPRVVRSWADWTACLEALRDARLLVVDVETHRRSPYVCDARLVGIGLGRADDPSEAWYVPLGAEDVGLDLVARRGELIDALVRLIDGPSRLVCHNATFDLVWLRDGPIPPDGRPLGLSPFSGGRSRVAYDTLCGSLLLRPGPHGLKELMTELAPPLAEYDMLLEAFLREHNLGRDEMGLVPLGIIGPYCAADVMATAVVMAEDRPRLDDRARTAMRLMLEAQPVLTELTGHGIMVDGPTLKRLVDERLAEIERLRREILSTPEAKSFARRCGRPVNLRSRRQLGEFLTRDVRLPIKRRTATGLVATGIDVLRRFADHPIVEKYIEIGRLEKELSTYLVAVRDRHLQPDGAVHAWFHIDGARTGRLSSSQPNLQNFPKRGGVRSMFRPRYDVFVEADLVNAEVAVVAAFADDASLKRVLIGGEDVHTFIACEIFSIDPDRVRDPFGAKSHRTYRDVAKAVTFGTIYGAGPQKIAETAHISVDAAVRLLHTFFNRFPAVRQYARRMERYAERHGLVRTPFGRVRFLPDAASDDPVARAEALRQAVNTPVQSAASDINLCGLIRFRRLLDEANLKSCVVNVVHDSILVDVPRDEIVRVVELLKQAYERMTFDWMRGVPIRIDIKVGRTWEKDEMVDWKEYLKLENIHAA